jgi:phosphohistidine phosphatase
VAYGDALRLEDPVQNAGDVMKRIYLLRHAKSSWEDPGLADRDRPLAPRGRKAAARMGAYLREQRIRPDVVLCSPSRRTRETVERMGKALAKALVEVDEGLYAAGAEPLLDRLLRLPEARTSVMLVAHNPGLHDLTLALATGAPPRLAEKFPTGALATLEHDGTWAELAPGSCSLTGFVVPRELG